MLLDKSILLIDRFHVDPNPARQPDQFRGNIPTMTAPDRGYWERAGHPAVEVLTLPPDCGDLARKHLSAEAMAHVLEAHKAHARSLLARDFTALTIDEAAEVHESMSALCSRVESRSGLDNVFVAFDPTTDSFWAYPIMDAEA